MVPNQSHFDQTEKRISLVYNSELSGFQALDFSKLDSIEDILTSGVTTKSNQSSNISTYSVGTINSTVLSGSEIRKELFVQNLATGTLYVKYGESASNSSFNFILAANTAEDAGDGGSLSDLNYTGIVSVSGIIGPRYIAWERS